MWRSMLTIGGMTMLSRLSGFARDVLMASLLGAGPVADAFFVAFKLPNFFRRLFAEGAFNAAFVPLFARLYAAKGLREACVAAEQILAALFTVLLGITLLFESQLPLILSAIAPGFHRTPERYQLALEYTQITFPYLVLISLSALFSGILNSLDRFAAASAAPILLNLCMIAALTLGDSLYATPGHALSWAVLLAGALQCSWMWLSASRAGAHLRLVWPRYTPAVQQLVRVMLPGAFGAGVVQVNLLVDTILASFLPTGSVSFLFYADRLNQLPLSVIGIAISTALLPQLSRNLQKGEKQAARHAQNRALEVSMMLTLPATLGLVVLAHPIIATLFQRGAFGAQEVNETAKVLAAFAIGLPAYVLVKVFSTSFFATYDTKTPVKAALVALSVNFVLNLALLQPLQHVGIALATAIASWINAGLLGYWLKRRQLFSRDKTFRLRFPSIVIATLVMGCVLYGLNALDWGVNELGTFWRFGLLLGTISLSLATYGTALLMLKVVEFRDISRIFVAR